MATLNLRLIGIVLLLAAILGTGLYIRHLRSEVAELTADKVRLEDAIGEQNAAIQAWKANAEARLTAAQDELARAEEQLKVAKGKAVVIYKAKPSKPNDACGSALDLINGGAK